jgi:hypothetical protein
MFVLPLDYFVGFITDEVASKRPALERWDMSSDSWMGSLYHEGDHLKSPLSIALAYDAYEKREKDKKERKMKKDDRNYNDGTGDLDFVEMGQVETDFIATRYLTLTLNLNLALNGFIWDRIIRTVL